MADNWHAPTQRAANFVVTSTVWNEETQDNFEAIYSAMVGDAQATSEVIHRHKMGTLAAIPAAGNAGRLYRTSDEGGLLFIDDGAKWVPAGVQILDRDLTPVTVANSAVEAPIYSHEIPAGALGATGGFRLTLGGAYFNNSGANRDLTLRINLGVTELSNTVITAITASVDWRRWRLELLLMNSAADAQYTSTFFDLTHASANVFPIGDPGTGARRSGVGRMASTEDTSAARTLEITVQHSFAHGSLSTTREIAVLELIPA